MAKTILVTGSTDGIGALTAELLADRGHRVLLHGRSAARLKAVAAKVGESSETYLADLSRIADVRSLGRAVLAKHSQVDVLINNAGVFKTANPHTPEGHDVRFVVNVLAPYVLTRTLLPVIPPTGRIVNLSSAAQAAVDVDAMAGRRRLADMEAYAQSKLALTVWSRVLAEELSEGPAVIAVNPGSLLASKMVREGFGVAGKDLRIGAEVLCQAALDASFAGASGLYFDNDSGRFAEPNAAALDGAHVDAVMATVEAVLADLGEPAF